jgi:hypothetical protein
MFIDKENYKDIYNLLENINNFNIDIYLDDITFINLSYKKNVNEINLIYFFDKIVIQNLILFLTKKYKNITVKKNKDLIYNFIQRDYILELKLDKIIIINILKKSLENYEDNTLFYNIKQKQLYLTEDKYLNELESIEKYTINFIKSPYYILNIIIFYLISNDKIFNTLIEEFIEQYKTDIILINIFNFKNEEYRKELLIFIKRIYINNIQENLIKLLEDKKYLIKILFNKEKIIYYNLSTDTIESFLKIVLINIYNIVNKDYIDYIKNIKKEQNSFNFLFDNNNLSVYRQLTKLKKDFSVDDKNLNYNVKTFVDIMSIMFHNRKDINYDIESIKMAIIFKNYNHVNKDFLKKEVFDLYNKIIEYISLDNKINENNYFFKMINNDFLINFEYNNYYKITQIKKDFINKKDNIDIIDYQDSFGLLYEHLYINKFELEEDKENMNEICQDFLNSILSNIRSNKLLNLDNNSKNEDISINVDEIDKIEKKEKINKKDNKLVNKDKEEYLKLKIFNNLINSDYFNFELLTNYTIYNMNDYNEDIIDILYYYYQDKI